MIYFHENYSSFQPGELFSVFVHALRLDLATTAYILILPIVVSTFAFFLGSRFLKVFNVGYNYLLLFLFLIILIADLGIYNAWGMKLNQRAVSNLAYPDEAIASIDRQLIVWQIIIGCIIGLVGIFLFRLLFRREKFYNDQSMPKWYLVPFGLLAIVFVNVLMLRGGLQHIPINESAAYFSNDHRLNHASVNTTWYVIHSVFENRENDNKRLFTFMSDSEAKKITDDMLVTNNEVFPKILATDKPNIVFIQLESFTADVVAALGGEKNVTPNLDTLIKNGLLFSNIYGSGFRTDQGLVAMTSGFPAQPTSSIIKQADKIERMPNVMKSLKQLGYKTSFYYGGELGFGNIKAFVLANNIDRYSSIDDYPESERGSKWGTHDEFVFSKQANDLMNEPEPFFSYLMTLSSHEPFDVPGPIRIDGKSEPERFMNSCAYTDHALGEYFKRVSQTTWYRNTIFILCADHGHSLPLQRAYNTPERFHIPLIFYGPALNDSLTGKRFETLGSQVDIASTLISMLGQNDSAFYWSNNLLSPTRKQFAYCSYDEGVGLLTQNGWIGYDFKNRRVQLQGGNADADNLKKLQAYLQTLMYAYEQY